MRALITGITGQDGSYLAEFLLAKGYEVYGLVQRETHTGCLRDLPALRSVSLLSGSITDPEAVKNAIAKTHPDECYHLAARTVVTDNDPSTIHTNVDGTYHLFAALAEQAPGCRVCFAGSAEMFGTVEHTPQTESTPFRPRSLYGVSKLAAYEFVRFFREQRHMFACCAILYNHESPRRSPQFVTRKITRGAARIYTKLETELRLGNLDTVRDWGDARDYVRGMWMMLQADRAADYILATGQGRTVREFLDAAFAVVNLDWREFVVVDERFYRPLETVALIGSPEKARRQLDWSPSSIFADWVREMVLQDCREIQNQRAHPEGS